jgi:mercuric ion transport protein
MHDGPMNARDLGTNSSQNSAVGNIGIGAAAMLALLSASCCIIPLALTIVGLGGAWLSILGPFVAYRGLILLGVTLVVLVIWWRVWRAGTQRRGVIMAGAVTAAAVLGWSAPLWEWEVAGVLMKYWTSQ